MYGCKGGLEGKAQSSAVISEEKKKSIGFVAFGVVRKFEGEKKPWLNDDGDDRGDRRRRRRYGCRNSTNNAPPSTWHVFVGWESNYARFLLLRGGSSSNGTTATDCYMRALRHRCGRHCFAHCVIAHSLFSWFSFGYCKLTPVLRTGMTTL